jgi:hypothetical protein
MALAALPATVVLRPLRDARISRNIAAVSLPTRPGITVIAA